MGFIGDVKLIAAICPRCGASLDFPEGMEKAHCMYCGTLIMIGKAAESSRIVECTVCDGMGKVDFCKACDGSGVCNWSTKGSGAQQNIFMLGYSAHCLDGMCSACKGTGHYMLSGCPGCEGTGRCPRCHGSGKCPACRGIGFMPNPNGSSNCPSCGGKGVRSLDSKSESSAPSTCPSCGHRLEPGWLRCPNCGLRIRPGVI